MRQSLNEEGDLSYDEEVAFFVDSALHGLKTGSGQWLC
jgi:hypothetical protein